LEDDPLALTKGIGFASCHTTKFKGSANEGNMSDGNNSGICVE
jgi:hypothetical protein